MFVWYKMLICRHFYFGTAANGHHPNVNVSSTTEGFRGGNGNINKTGVERLIIQVCSYSE
jgi:hypothetical protein